MPLHIIHDKSLKTLTSIPGWAEEYNASATGEKGVVNAYLNSAWAFRAISIRADGFASAPILLLDANDEEIEDHPVLELLERVNSEWNSGDLWRYTESAFCVFGSAFWQKVRAGRRITELMFMNPQSVEVLTSVSGISGFKQTLGGSVVTYPRQDVVYFRGGYSPTSDLTGIAPLSLASLAAAGEQKADQYMAAFYANYAVPPLILTTDQQITDSMIDKVRAWWDKMFRGVKNQFKTGIVGNGLKPVQLSSNVKDMAIAETRAEMHRTICVALGVDELLLSSTGAADRTPVDAALYHLYTTTIIPRWTYCEEVLNAELIPEYPDLVKRGAYFKFDQKAVKPLQDDQNEWAKTLCLLVEKGIIRADVAAIELGYSNDDIPEEKEPEPIPPQLVIPPIPQEPTEDETEPEGKSLDIRKQMIDMKTWKRLALKAIRNGEPASFEFVTTAIPEPLYVTISSALGQAKTEEDVKRAFEAGTTITPAPVYEDGIMALAVELKRANDLLEKYSDEPNTGAK